MHELGDIVRVSYTFGAGELVDVPGLTVNDAAGGIAGNSIVKVALDCIDGASAVGRGLCLGFGGADPSTQDDGDAILYAGGLTYGSLVGAVCDGITFTADSAGTAGSPAEFPNLVTFTASDVLEFQQDETCFVAFDVVVNSIGDTPEPSPTQALRGAAGFEGTCIPDIIGADSSPSLAYIVELDRELIILKEVSVDGGPWFDANAEPPPFPTGFVPFSTAQYRITVTNTGEEPLVDVVINDPTLGLSNVPIPVSCLVDGALQPNDPCVITSGDAGFAPLSDPGICETQGLKTNIACTNGNGAFSGLPAGEVCDPANVVCLAPGLEVTKDGPPLAKVGDAVDYTICATNTGAVDLANCTLDDTLLGPQGPFAALLVPGQQVCGIYSRTVLPTDPDPLPNTATVTCEVVGAGQNISDFDDHVVELFQPSIVAIKTGPEQAKVGDEVCYEIGFNNASSPDTPPLVNCTGVDTLLDLSGAVFVDGQTQTFCRTALASDPNPLPNTATITCEVDGWDNDLPAPASASHEVDLYTTGAILTKDCAPDTTIIVPDPISWEICLENTGTLDITCDVSDPTAGIAGTIIVPAGATDCSFTASRPTTPDDVGTVMNTATAVCTAIGWDNDVPTAPATDSCVVAEPGLEVTKDGPPLAKVGDEITYTICATNDGSTDLANCTLDDTLLGPQGTFAALLVPGQTQCNVYPYTVGPTDPDPLPNLATVTCDVVGSAQSVSDSDDHVVELFQPSIVAIKTGPEQAKVGDEVCYEIGFNNTSSPDTPPLVNCTGADTLLDLSGAVFVDGQTQTFCRTVLASDPNPLPNTATITCEVDGWDNGMPDPASASHEVDVYRVGAILSKDCTPDTTITVPDPISWEICVENTGTLDISCDVSDPTAGIAGTIIVPPGAMDCSLTASRPTTSADVPMVMNTATAVCTAVGWDNDVPTEPAMDTCTVDEPRNEICRTPGFWGTHAGMEKAGRSTNLTQKVIDYAGGSLGTICGVEITNTSVHDYEDPPAIPVGDGNGSATEAICVPPKGLQVRQLARQLTAAALNCVVSGRDPDCWGVSIYDDFTAANAACAANDSNLSHWIGIIDAFNNGYDSDCHERDLKESPVFENVDYKVPGPAGSSHACNAATQNEFYLVP